MCTVQPQTEQRREDGLAGTAIRSTRLIEPLLRHLMCRCACCRGWQAASARADKIDWEWVGSAASIGAAAFCSLSRPKRQRSSAHRAMLSWP